MDQSRPNLDTWVGRETELATLQSWLAQLGIRLIGIQAAGGYGKSALAAKLCAELGQGERVIWTTFSEGYQFEGWGGWLLEQLTGTAVGRLTMSDLPGQLLNALGQGKTLLVLDNLETLLTEQGEWREPIYGIWLQRVLETGRCQVVVTSREQVRLPGNLQNRSRWLRLGGLEPAAGLTLLQQWGVEGTAAELADFVTVCDGHPLLMDLAVGTLRYEFGDCLQLQLLAQLTTPLFHLLGQHRGDAEASIAALLDFSIDRLPEELRDLVLQIWVYPMPFNLVRLNDAYPHWEATVPQCRQLARCSLLQERCEDGVWEFWFQPLIRDYLQHRVLADCRQRGDRWGEANTLQAIGDVLQFLDRRDEALSQYGAALGLYDQVGAKLGKANTLRAIGRHYLTDAGNIQCAFEHFSEALEISKQIGDRLGEAASYIYLGRYCLYQEDWQSALDQLSRAISVYQSIGTPFNEAISWQDSGQAWQALGQTEQALAAYQRAQALYQQANYDAGVVACEAAIAALDT